MGRFFASLSVPLRIASSFYDYQSTCSAAGQDRDHKTKTEGRDGKILALDKGNALYRSMTFKRLSFSAL